MTVRYAGRVTNWLDRYGGTRSTNVNRNRNLSVPTASTGLNTKRASSSTCCIFTTMVEITYGKLVEDFWNYTCIVLIVIIETISKVQFTRDNDLR